MSNLTREQETTLRRLEATVRPAYKQPWRQYHNLEHIHRVQRYIRERYPDHYDFCMQMAVLLHDYICEPDRMDNERRTVDAFRKMDLKLTEDEVAKISDLIRATGTPYSNSLLPDEKIIVEADWNGMAIWDTLDTAKMLFLEQWCTCVRKEYQYMSVGEGIVRREDFLKEARANNAISKEVFSYAFVRSKDLWNVALYPGTFDPFTVRDEKVVKQLTNTYEKVIVAKLPKNGEPVDLEPIKRLLPHLEVVAIKNSVIEYLKNTPIPGHVSIISNPGNVTEFVQCCSRTKARMKRLEKWDAMPEIDEVWIPTNPDIDYVTESFVNELPDSARKPYLPKGVIY